MAKFQIALNTFFTTKNFLKHDHNLHTERNLTPKELLYEYENINWTKFKLVTLAYNLNDEWDQVSIEIPLKLKKDRVSLNLIEDNSGFNIFINSTLKVSLRSGVKETFVEYGEGFRLSIVGIFYKGGGWSDGFKSLIDGFDFENRSTWKNHVEIYDYL